MTFTIRHDIIRQYVMKRKQSSLSPQRILRCGSGSYCTAARDRFQECGQGEVWILSALFLYLRRQVSGRNFFLRRGMRVQKLKLWIKQIIYQVWRCTTISNLMINEQIRDKEVRLIGPDGEQLGIMSAREAMAKAQEAELDLMEVPRQAKPPVCKIIDYGKYRYELARKEKEAKKKQKTIDVKEVRLSPNIDTNDLNTKAGAARKFLTKGDRVKVTLRFRGREMAHMSSSKHVLDDFADM